MGYKNFEVAIFCTVGNLIGIQNLDEFRKHFQFIEKNVRVDKVYLETYRGGHYIARDKMLEIKKFFDDKGIKTSGAITTMAEPKWDGFNSFCYTNRGHRDQLKSVAEFTAGLFDEIILDDFYFTNCKCESCIKEKGDRNWADYRIQLMREVSEKLVVGPAKKVNPKINMIIKYPNWYENYQDTGYNLEDEAKQFDMVYTGTETRNAQYAQQHLPRYLSYFVMRYLENVKPGKNGGGWFDPYECTYNPGSYAEQTYLTLFGKAKEVTLFCLGSLLEEDGRIFIPIAGHVFDTLDERLGNLGTPVGTACYIPYHSFGEDYIHNYFGMLGIPLEPFPQYPENYTNIFLTADAAKDENIVGKIRASLINGGNVVITSGLLKALQGKGFETIANIRYTGRKAVVNRYQLSGNGGITFTYYDSSDRAVTIPQLEFSTNDTWQMVAGLGEENNFPVLLRVNYGKGHLYIVTVPDDFGDLYHYPKEVLKCIRKAFAPDALITLENESKIGLFVYDNGTFIVESFLPYFQDVTLTIGRPEANLINLANGREIEGTTVKGKTTVTFNIPPAAYRMFKINGSSQK